MKRNQPIAAAALRMYQNHEAGILRQIGGKSLEGMACKGGCTNGAASIFHDQRGIQRVNDFSRLALTDNPMEGIRGYDMAGVNMEREFPELEKMKEITAGEKRQARQATAKAKKGSDCEGRGGINPFVYSIKITPNFKQTAWVRGFFA